MCEESGADSEDDGHRADHQRSVRDGGEREAGELDEELQRNAEEGAEQKQAPVAAVEAWTVEEQKREQCDGREEEAVEDHCADVHFGERDLAEEESAAPERAGEGAGCEAEGAVSFRTRHVRRIATRHGMRRQAPSARPSCN